MMNTVHEIMEKTIKAIFLLDDRDLDEIFSDPDLIITEPDFECYEY